MHVDLPVGRGTDVHSEKWETARVPAAYGLGRDTPGWTLLALRGLARRERRGPTARDRSPYSRFACIASGPLRLTSGHSPSAVRPRAALIH